MTLELNYLKSAFAKHSTRRLTVYSMGMAEAMKSREGGREGSGHSWPPCGTVVSHRTVVRTQSTLSM